MEPEMAFMLLAFAVGHLPLRPLGMTVFFFDLTTWLK
jgi:hypothetical protein